MISNFDDSFDGEPEEPEIPTPQSSGFNGAEPGPASLTNALNGPLGHAMRNLLRNQLPEAERKFADTKAHPDALKVLHGMTPKDISSWFFRKQEVGEIPGDWPEPNCEKPEKEGAPIKALDWPTFVLFTSLIHSGDGLSLLPSSYDDVRHFIWYTNSDVLLVWDSHSKMAQMALGNDKTNYLALKNACDNQQLLIVSAVGTAPYLATAFKTLYSAIEELDPAVLKQALELAAERSGDTEKYREYVNMTLEVWARLMVHQVHGFHLHRCVIHGVILSDEEEGRDTPVVRMKLVLCHYDECGGKGVHHDSVVEAITSAEPNLDVDTVIDEADDVFDIYQSNREWARIEANEWVLTPRAKAHLDEILRNNTLAVL